MATFRLSILMAVLILGGCQAPSTPARFITDTSVDSSLSLVSFSDPRDYFVEVIRVDTQGKQTTVSSHELIAHREGLAGVLYVQARPRLRIVGRGVAVGSQGGFDGVGFRVHGDLRWVEQMTGAVCVRRPRKSTNQYEVLPKCTFGIEWRYFRWYGRFNGNDRLRET